METTFVTSNQRHQNPSTNLQCLRSEFISSATRPLMRGDSALAVEPSAKQVHATTQDPKNQTLDVLQVSDTLPLISYTGSPTSPTRSALSRVACQNNTDRPSTTDQQRADFPFNPSSPPSAQSATHHKYTIHCSNAKLHFARPLLPSAGVPASRAAAKQLAASQPTLDLSSRAATHQHHTTAFDVLLLAHHAWQPSFPPTERKPLEKRQKTEGVEH